MGQITANALAWAGLRSAGGPRKCFCVTIGYGAVVLGLLILSLATNPQRNGDVFESASMMILIAQFVLMAIVAGLTILNTIQKDRNSKMLESHRLMPIHPRLAVLGYIAGGAAPYCWAVLFNFIVGGMTAAASGMPMEWWLAANVVAITFGMFLWTIAAVGGFCGLIAGVAISIPFGIIILSGGQAGSGIPSVLMLVSPVLGSSVFSGKPPSGDDTLLWSISFILQIGVGWVFVEMAARRFRQQDIPLLPAGWGLLLLTLLAGAAAIAVNTSSVTLPFRRGYRSQIDPMTMATGTYILLLIVAAIVITSAAASDRLEHPRRRAKIADAKSLLLVLAVTLIATAFASLVPAILQGERVLWTVALFLVCGLLTQLLAKWVFRIGAGNVPLVCFALLLSLAPLLLSAAFMDGDYRELTTTGRIVSQVSPFSMIVAIWSNGDAVEAQPLSLLILASFIAIPMFLLTRRKHGDMSPMLKA